MNKPRIRRSTSRRMPDWRILLGLAALCVTGFALLAWLSRTEAGHQIDLQMLLALQTMGEETLPRGPAWLHEAARDLTALGSISLLIFCSLAAWGWLALMGRWRTGLVTVAIIFGGILMSFALKLAFDQPRPNLVSGAPEVFTNSFPSSHAMSSLITYLALAIAVGMDFRSRSLRIYLAVLGVVVSAVSGLSRIYLGVHWPSDVLGGWLIGIAWLAIAGFFARTIAGNWMDAAHSRRRPSIP